MRNILTSECRLILQNKLPTTLSNTVLNLVKLIKSKNQQFEVSINNQENKCSYDFPENMLKLFILVKQFSQLVPMLEIQKFATDHKIPVTIQILHSLCHIEYNAIKSYIDTIMRFNQDIKQQHYQQFLEDFSMIALEETLHFNMLLQELKIRGYNYGSLPTHDSLYFRVTQTQLDILDRLASVSIVSEGRGMDRGDNLVQKVLKDNDQQAAKIIKKIVQDEKGHVEIGLKWFNMLCKEYRNVDPAEKFLEIMIRLKIKQNWKINTQKRIQTGFDQSWFDIFEKWKLIL